MTPALEVQGLWKSFPGVIALRDVSLAIAPGEVHALVGENGAGKSTLVKILAGAQAPDEGSITVYGHVHRVFTPRHARDAGIAVIHQERQIAPDLSVTENILLGRLPAASGGRIKWAEARKIAASALRSLDAEIDLDARVQELPAAQRQLLEIARALHGRARVVLMDEPTSSLGAHDATQLFRATRRLRDAGVAVIFSHHLEEVLDLADRVSVLRDGRLVITTTPAEVDQRKLAELMIGRPLPTRAETIASLPRELLTRALVLEDVAAPPGLAGVSLTVSAGEIVCVSGLVGSGRRELSHVAAFIRPPSSGHASAFGATPSSIREAVRHGIAYLSDDRKGEAILPGQTVFDNVALGPLVAGRGWRATPGRSKAEIRKVIGRVGVDLRRIHDRIDLLSGGNQQKALLARWISVGVRLYILDEPTVGVDVGARADIYGLLREQAAAGAAILIFSSDFEEIREVAHRALVLRAGRIAGELEGDQITVDNLVALQHQVA